MGARLDGNYSLIFASNVLEYVAPDKKKAFVDKMMESTKPGGINIICFATSLPKDFVERLLEYPQSVGSKLPIKLFEGSEHERALSLDFESGLLDLYRKSGWRVIKANRHEGERNFVGIQMETIIVQKPLTEELSAKRD